MQTAGLAEYLTQWQELAERFFPSLLKPRPEDSNKGTFGTLAVIGGSAGMSGSVVLAAEAALKSGCGRVHIGFAQSEPPVPFVPGLPEIMTESADTLIRRTDITARAVGCGLGTGDASAALLEQVLQNNNTPLLLDADALNLVARDDSLKNLLRRNSAFCLLTPHPAEAARLLHGATADIQADRPAALRALCREYRAAVVLKGFHTLVAASDADDIYTNPTGNPGLATAGSGDVLAGIIGALLAGSVPALEAVRAGVMLHGAAADWLAACGVGPVGLCAGELPDAVRFVRNRLLAAVTDER